MMKACFTAMFGAALLTAVSVLPAQDTGATRPGEFFELLTECLAQPRASVHECSVEYLQAADPGATSEFRIAPDQPATQGSIVKGKYNTCRIYSKGVPYINHNGYSCYSNSTGQCVSGDCCDYVDTSC